MFLGLDLGTSGLKGLLLDENGVAIASATAHYDVLLPQTGWSEQETGCWIDALRDVVAQLSQKNAAAIAQLKAISFSGHMHGAVCVDKIGEVLRPCILWNDMRSASQAAELDGDERFRAICGNIVFPGFTAPKLVWMAQNEPSLFERVHKVLLPKDYLIYWLTGRFVTDCSDASGTAWFDVGARQWSEPLINACGLSSEHMPDVVEGNEVVGSIQPDIASELGLPSNVQIVAGGADNAVAACGAGAVEAGQGFVSLGTSGVVLVASDKYASAPETAVHSFCHALPARWYQMGVMLSATNSMNWLSQILGKTPSQLDALVSANSTDQTPSNICFLPYLSGERTPHNDALARGSFFGLSIDHSEADLVEAVMQGVGFGLKDCLDALLATGTKVDSLLAMGGGSNSEFWLQRLANILGVNLLLPQQGDYGAALGAARLAMAGSTNENLAALMKPPEIAKEIKPDAGLASAFQEAHTKYQKVYESTKDIK